MTCQHTEGHGWSEKRGRPLVDKHDCGYVDERNRLLDAAATYADQRHPEPDLSDLSRERARDARGAWRDAWSRSYLRRVDHLWAQAHPEAEA